MRFDDEVVKQQISLLAIGLGLRVGGGLDFCLSTRQRPPANRNLSCTSFASYDPR